MVFIQTLSIQHSSFVINAPILQTYIYENSKIHMYKKVKYNFQIQSGRKKVLIVE